MRGIGDNGGPEFEDEDNPFGPTGWIKVSRGMREHHLVGFGRFVKAADPERGFCYSRSEAWLDLLMECRWRPGYVMNKGRKMEIKPGQILGAVSWLAERWNWTPKTVRWFLDQLQEDGMIERMVPDSGKNITQTSEIETDRSSDVSLNGVKNGNRHGTRNGNQSSILTISKYEIFQFISHIQRQPKGQPEGQPDGNRAATERQPHGNTLRREEGKNLESVRDTREALPAQPKPETPPGEPLGHGVFADGDTIRHRGFAISLPAIRMATIAAALPADEIRTRCLAHALQWGAEIEAGKMPRDVVPSKITNFLSASIMAEVNKAAAQAVRLDRERTGWNRTPPNPDKPKETQSERLMRLAMEMEKGGKP